MRFILAARRFNLVRKFYREATPKLKHEVMLFTEEEIALLGESYASTIATRGYTCHGCAIMPDHVHMLIRKHRDKAEEMIAYLQDDSWRRLIDEKRRPSDHPVWGGPGWKVYLDSREAMERTERYIEANPRKAKLAEQHWEFVTKYDGWLPGVGSPRK